MSKHQVVPNDLLPTTPLTEVSFQHHLRSAGGPEKGYEKVQAQLSALQSRRDVSFSLSPEQLAHYTAARDFLSNRYADLGLPFHASGHPFVYSRPNDGQGILKSVSRSPGVHYDPSQPREAWQLTAFWVHELTHGTGAVLWGASRSENASTSWDFSISRAGCMMQSRSSRYPSLDGRQQGQLFEEYAACSNESHYHRVSGEVGETFSTGSINIGLQRNREADLTIIRLITQIYEPASFIEIESSPNPRRWERELLKSQSSRQIPVPELKWTSATTGTSYSTYQLLPLMDELAQEIFPCLSPLEASTKFRAMTIEAHTTGRLAQLLVPIREALGPEALRFLLQWGTLPRDIYNGEDTGMLALFVKAGSLGPAAARIARKELLDAALQRKNAPRFPGDVESVEVEALIVAAEKDNWKAWLSPNICKLAQEHVELNEIARERFNRSLIEGDLSLAALLATAVSPSAIEVPFVSPHTLERHARKLLAAGSVADYERLVNVFSPSRPLIDASECRELIHRATESSLAKGDIDVFCEVATSSLCDLKALLTPRVRRRAVELLDSLHFMARIRLQLALEGKPYPT